MSCSRALQSMAPLGCIGVTSATMLPVIIGCHSDAQLKFKSMFMVAQLSTSSTDKQPAMSHTFMLALLLLLLSCGTTAWAQGSLWEQPSDVEIRIEPLSTIDQQFMG